MEYRRALYKNAFGTIVNNHLSMTKFSARWVQKLCQPDSKQLCHMVRDILVFFFYLASIQGDFYRDLSS